MAIGIIQKELHGIIILELAGRLVLGQENMDFRAKIKEVLDNSDWFKEKWGWETRIVLDLGNVSFLGSAGLGALIAARISAMNRGAGMKLANLTKKIKDQLHITKLVTVFDVYDSVEAAVNSFPQAITTTGTAPA
ncbi:MAG: STAS domain-containing protein [Acidobacteriia bacterium]|nr:STAS domain-containing protein [Terriglobia bacterium]